MIVKKAPKTIITIPKLFTDPLNLLFHTYNHYYPYYYYYYYYYYYPVLSCR